MFNWFKKKPVSSPRWRIVQRPHDYAIQEYVYAGEGDWYWEKHSSGYKTEDDALIALEIIRNPKIIYV